MVVLSEGAYHTIFVTLMISRVRRSNMLKEIDLSKTKCLPKGYANWCRVNTTPQYRGSAKFEDGDSIMRHYLITRLLVSRASATIQQLEYDKFVSEYEYDEKHPIKVTCVSNKYYVVDGLYRAAALLSKNKKYIDVKVVPSWMVFISHGLAGYISLLKSANKKKQ